MLDSSIIKTIFSSFLQRKVLFPSSIWFVSAYLLSAELDFSLSMGMLTVPLNFFISQVHPDIDTENCNHTQKVSAVLNNTVHIVRQATILGSFLQLTHFTYCSRWGKLHLVQKNPLILLQETAVAKKIHLSLQSSLYLETWLNQPLRRLDVGLQHHLSSHLLNRRRADRGTRALMTVKKRNLNNFWSLHFTNGDAGLVSFITSLC